MLCMVWFVEVDFHLELRGKISRAVLCCIVFSLCIDFFVFICVYFVFLFHTV